ncbi:MAG: outer membrane lipoprotein carrier protein LolA, partial [Cyclobacteriaceae bacterium]
MFKKLIVLIILNGWVPLLAISQSDPEATAILSKVSEKYQELNGFRAIFEYAYSSKDDGLIQTNTGEVTVKGDKYRLVLDDQEVFNNGETVWTLIKSSKYKEVTINSVEEDIDELTPSNIYNIYKKGYQAQLVGEGMEGGRPVYEIQLTSENASSQFQKIKLYVDKTEYDFCRSDRSTTRL